MNISYNWLKEYVDFDLSPQQVADALTAIGLETGSVEEVQTIKGGLEGLVIGQVLTCEPHPNSDHMHVTTVDLGDGKAPVQIVCGAPNVEAGQKVVVAPIGTKLYAGDDSFTIKRSKLRGVESLGMICAEDEIGIGNDHSGIIVLPQEATVGQAAKDYYGIKSDYVLEVDITPNRADACSHYGVARDLYASLVSQGITTNLHRPSVDGFHTDNHDLPIDIRVENAEACPRYAGVTVSGVSVKESPKWLQEALKSVGLRPINNVVDITNYIVHAYGQPLHCFDADKITGGTVVVKTMPKGTPFVTLDGVERKLDDHDLMICNTEEAMCIGGVFGGLNSGTTTATTNVFLESAYFHPTWIRKTARRHGLSTDASFRFERGIDPDSVIYCLKRAALLVKELAGGNISSDIVDIYPVPTKPFRVEVDYAKFNALIGKEIPRAQVKLIAHALEMKTVAETAEAITFDVPPYRVDVQRPCDVAEDILRIYGYNNVELPTAMQCSLAPRGEEDKSVALQNLVAEQLVGCGFNEILNNSLTRAAYYDGLQSYPSERLVRLLNPLSADLNVMRQTLLFGGLESIVRNVNRQSGDLRLFEFGNVYTFDGHAKTDDQQGTVDPLAAYHEELHLGLWLTGQHIAGSWAHPDEPTSVHQLTAYVHNILRRIGLNPDTLSLKPGDEDIYAKSISLQTPGGKVLANIGIVSPKLTHRQGIDNEVYFAELNWTALRKAARSVKVNFTELPKHPAVRRDLALLVDNNVEFADIVRIARDAERKLLRQVSLFDVYQGKNLPEGKKSYAVSFILQDPTQTLTDKQIDKTMQRLVKLMEQKLGATLR